MTAMEAITMAERLLPAARLWVRKSKTNLDDEIRQTVAACFMDLKNAGVVNFNAEDPLLQQAAKLYTKAHFGYDDDPAKWEAAYEHLKAALSLSGDYNEVRSDG